MIRIKEVQHSIDIHGTNYATYIFDDGKKFAFVKTKKGFVVASPLESKLTNDTILQSPDSRLGKITPNEIKFQSPGYVELRDTGNRDEMVEILDSTDPYIRLIANQIDHSLKFCYNGFEGRYLFYQKPGKFVSLVKRLGF